jgi:lysophospholipase L1-like esterase
LSPFGDKKKYSFLSGRTVPAAALCVLFCAFFIYLCLTDSFSFPSPGEAPQPDAAVSDAPEIEAPEAEELPSPRPELLRTVLSPGPNDRFSKFPRLDSLDSDAVFFADNLKYVFSDGHGDPLYRYEFGADIPESDAVDDGYFSDSAFIGNSIMEGFMLYGGIKTADYYAKKSINVVNISTNKVIPSPDGDITIMEALASKDHAKIFILLGINEISFTAEHFCECYSSLISDIRALQPDADIYILSLTPVTRSKSEDGSKFNKDNILAYNESLRRLAAKDKVHYVDIYGSMADEEGFLPEDGSFDGIHPYSQYYRQWADCLRTHTVVTADRRQKE